MLTRRLPPNDARFAFTVRAARSCFSSKVNADPKQSKSDHEHCVALVQQRDKEGYLCGLLMPSSARKHYFALRAFNAELAFIKDGSERRRSRPSEEAGGSLAHRMRMQWWREALNELYPDDAAASSAGAQDASGFMSSINASYWHNPVVRSLNLAVQESNLTRRFLERLVDAREADLDIQQLPTMDNAALYAEDTMSSLLYLTLECCGVREDAADDVASNVGIGCGLVTALRAAPHRALSGEVSIPLALFPNRHVPADYLLARHADQDYRPNQESEAALKEAVQHMAHVASGYLSRASSGQDAVPKQGRAALLPAVPAIHYLLQLKDANYDLFDERLHPDRSRLVLLSMMARAWFTGKF